MVRHFVGEVGKEGHSIQIEHLSQFLSPLQSRSNLPQALRMIYFPHVLHLHLRSHITVIADILESISCMANCLQRHSKGTATSSKGHHHVTFKIFEANPVTSVGHHANH